MSLRDLVEPECGGANPLMRLGAHVTRDAAYKDEGLAGPGFIGRPRLDDNQFVDEFLGQISGPPQTFRMHDLLNEMREIDKTFPHQQIVRAPPVIDQVNTSGIDWAKEFASNHTELNFSAPGKSESEVWGSFPASVPPPSFLNANQMNWTNEFFELNEAAEKNQTIKEAATELVSSTPEDQAMYSEFMKFMKNVSDGDTQIDHGRLTTTNMLFDSVPRTSEKNSELQDTSEDWVESFNASKSADAEDAASYNNLFWNRLQEEWKRISEQDDSGQHPWLNEFAEYYDPYKEYKFDEEHSIDVENAFEKGKAFMEQGDIPSAVLCFETAAKQNPENAEIWELLGLAQAENEKDPNAIAAMKKSLELQPGNAKLLMALAVSYTNESIHNLALKSLINWMCLHPKYQNLVPPHLIRQENDGAMASSLIKGPDLKEVEHLFLSAVQLNPKDIDPEIQEALGVLFNLSSDYDKAVDCFRAALQVRPDNAKTWNRLGASLANGNRSVEAVEAYKRALDIHPGYIRARYNVGIICINLKSYKEAAEHFLTALNHQATSTARSGLSTVLPSNKMSETIWSTLRMTISLMGRHDLQTAITDRDLDVLNRELSTVD